MIYATDNKGKLPIPIGGGSLGNLSYSAILMKPDNMYWRRRDFGQGTLAPYLQSAAVAVRLFSCPSDPDPRWGAFQPFTADRFAPLTPDPITSRNFSYVFNGNMVGDVVNSEYLGIKVSDIRRPSDKFLVQEMFMPVSSSRSAMVYNVNGISNVVFLSLRHGGKSNQCFADGHVQMFDPDVLRDSTVADPLKATQVLHHVILRAQ